MHKIINLLELTETAGLVWGLDETSSEELNGLGRIGSVADVGTLDGDHLNDGLKNRCAEVGSSW